ncbi:thioredoxin [Oscillochloris sp. ZM17-4]|uniref:thioredoxin n=1 Tax=Oscillochloris sp. ZM17-4 TaxID=2866714 RepID=UPI001C72C152|nr:thioredoxin [Oscillochloris sp. ZM17-4]MBX0327867.1 thioredoxin [Oscillochloris sp. ZM17-4]
MLSGVKQTPTTQRQPAVIEVDEANFEQEVIARSKDVPVVIDFWAPWCGPCRTLGPTLERLASEAKGDWVLAKVNVDENQRLSANFRIQSIPAVKAVYGGKIVDEFVGALPESQVRTWLKRFMPEKGGSLLDAAQAMEAGDPQGAAARYRLILGEEPENTGAMFRLGRLLMLLGEAEGVETLRQVPLGAPLYARAQAMLPLADFFAAADLPAEGDVAERYRQAATLARDGAYAGAMSELIAIVARDRAFRDDGARKALLGFFAALGDEDPLVPVYRRKLANTLF